MKTEGLGVRVGEAEREREINLFQEHLETKTLSILKTLRNKELLLPWFQLG